MQGKNTPPKKKVLIIENQVYSRVVGYYRPVSNWNIGKQKEFSERKLLKAPYKDKRKVLKIG